MTDSDQAARFQQVALPHMDAAYNFARYLACDPVAGLVEDTQRVLASQGREMFRVARWRKNMDQHVVVVGYGTKGRSAVETLINNGLDKESIVVVDPSTTALGEAHADGFAVVTGDATRREVLRRAGVAKASQVIITTDRDDSTVLSTLNVRQLNPNAYVVAAVRESDNVALVQQHALVAADGEGVVVNVGSIAGFLAYEGGGGYTVAKHGVHVMTETLRLELVDQPVRITEMCSVPLSGSHTSPRRP